MRNAAWKRLAAGVLAGCLVMGLSACGGGGLTEKDAETYVKGHLDAAYLGVYDKAYIDLVEDMTEDDAREMHEQNVADETEYYFLDFLEIEYPTDEIVERAEEVMEQIYARSKYTVGTGSRTKDGDFVVEVTVSPLDLYNLLTDEDYADAWDAAAGDLDLDTVTEEEYAAADAAYARAMLDLVEEQLEDAAYGKDQIVMLQLKKDDDGYYALVETGMQKVDEVMLDYGGYYTE